MRIVEQYLLQLNTEKQRLRRITAILTVLSILVVSVVSWNLRLTGITLANDAVCGQEEHRHTETCPVEKVLICGYDPENAEADTETPTEAPTEAPTETPTEAPAETQPEATAEPNEEVPTEVIPEESVPLSAGTDLQETATAHVHTDACYEIRYLCGFEEHTHKVSCYSDLTADIEAAADWEATLPIRTTDWSQNLVQIAQSQLGCRESEQNFELANDGRTRNGITRYGQWYGNPYGDWSAMFAAFCLRYAQVPQEAVPRSPGTDNMLRLAQDAQILSPSDSAQATAGDLLFLDTDDNEKADKIAIVTAVNEDEVIFICGDWENAVHQVTLSHDATFETDGLAVVGRICIAAQQKLYEQAQQESKPETEPDAVEAPETEAEDVPRIILDLEADAENQQLLFTAQLENIDDAMYSWQWQVSEDGSEPWADIEGAEGLFYAFAATEENAARYYRLQGRKLEQMRTTFALPKADTSKDEENGTITSGAVSPFSIDKEQSNYTIDVYALPVDGTGNRIPGMNPTNLGNLTVNNTTKTAVSSRFNEALGTYLSAYFGTETSVTVDDIVSVWRNDVSLLWWTTYYLAYQQEDGTVNDTWLDDENQSISLYLRYIPALTVTFASEYHDSLTEKVSYNGCPTKTEPGAWTYENHTLVGWTVDGDAQTVYSYEEILSRPVTGNVTYRAVWRNTVTVSYDLGAYAYALYPIEPETVSYGDTLLQPSVPAWRDNAVVMAFDGWYLDPDHTKPLTADHKFYQDTTLYAGWTTKDDGFYVYFMDFNREEEKDLVLLTSSVTEGKTVSPHIPSNPPAGTDWDGNWYLDKEYVNAFDFRTPVSQMTDYLTGVNGRDLYLYPGTQDISRAIFVTYGTRIDPVAVPRGGSINLDRYVPERSGYEFAGWTLKDGTPVSGKQVLNETTTYYATWSAGYVPFEAILRIENANDTDMTQAKILGTWYAKAGSQIVVKSTYSGSGDRQTGTHRIVSILDGVEYPVYEDATLREQAMLDDVYETYFVYNNTGTSWTDEVNWDDVYTGGQLPYSTRPISSAGDTIINFDYMRVRDDVVFEISNSKNGAYIDVYKLYRDGLITGSVTYGGTRPTAPGSNISATGVSGTNISWTYTATTKSSGNNTYTLHDVKYGQRIYEVYPVGGSWLTTRGSTAFYAFVCNSTNYASRREDLSSNFFSGSGRAANTYTLSASFSNGSNTALMYAIECLPGETADFTLNNVGYKVQTQLCEVVNSSGTFSAKELLGCTAGTAKNYSNPGTTSSKIGDTSVSSLFSKYEDYYTKYTGVSSVSSLNRAYIFYYERIEMSVQFNFAYDSDGDGKNQTVGYQNIVFDQNLAEYQFGKPGFQEHELLNREGYEFVGWLDANGFVLEAENWKSLVAVGDSEDSSMIFVAKWEKISNNIVEYYEDISATDPFEVHYFDDGELLEYPTMSVFPQGWVWQEYGEGYYGRFDWDVPMYGDYGVRETRTVNGEPVDVNVIRIYGTWDESHTKVVYDPNPAQGGVPGTAPVDSNEYTIWQSEVSVMSRNDTSNADPNKVFVGWLLDRNGVVYQPGDHVSVHWPRTMIFKAQWAEMEEIVHLRYDSNGGTPESYYPNESGFSYKKGATASVWDNTESDGSEWYRRTGYTFTGWNTQPDGSGTEVKCGSNIVLEEAVTTLYAQWQKETHSLYLHKIDRISKESLSGAVFEIYRQENGEFTLLETLTTGTDGYITFTEIETGEFYKLVEARPPAGYGLITREVYFRLTPGTNAVSLEFCDSGGNVISAPSGISGEYIAGSRQMMLTVQNVAGFELPSTGGSGITLYILCGAFLVLAPLVYGFSLRRRYRKGAKT